MLTSPPSGTLGLLAQALACTLTAFASLAWPPLPQPRVAPVPALVDLPPTP